MVGRVAGVGAVLLAVIRVAAGSQVPLLDPTEGEILGRAALAFLALDETGSRVLPIDDLEVHLAPIASPDDELVFPGGEWISPPPGEYRFWLEGGGRISMAHGIFGYSAPPFQGRGSVTARPTVPAGIVALVPDLVVTEDEEVRLLHSRSHNAGDSPQPEMSRRIRGSRAYEGVLMPAGPIVAGIYSRASGGYAMISRPVEVTAGALAELDLEPPARGTDVVAVLDRPRAARTFEEYDTAAFLTLPGGEERPPDLTIPTAERLFAIWYGIEGRLATLGVRSSTLHLAPRDVALRPNKVETVRGTLAPLPSLRVTVSLPPDYPIPADATIEVLRETTGEVAARRELGSDAGAVLFPALPAERLKVVVSVPPFRQTERVDLSGGADGELEVALRALRVSGTVYRGDRPCPARLEFGFWSGPKYRTTVETDAEGRYQADFLRPPYAVMIRLGERESPYAQNLLHEEFDDETRLDLHVPANAFDVVVVDAETGNGIPNAGIGVVNIWGKTPDGDDLSSALRVEASKDGRAELPPLRPGEVWLTAEAPGYRTPDHLKFPLREDEGGREITLRLEREGAVGRVRILLPTGPPAAGAEAIVVESLDGAVPTWRGAADGAGWLEPPASAAGRWLVVKHPAAAFAVRRAPASGGEETWSLPPAASPLSLRVVRSWGDPAPWARLALRVDGTVLGGSLLQWVAGSSAADGAGSWRGSGLPAGTIEAVAWVPVHGVPRDPVALLASFGRVVPPRGVAEIEAVE